MIHEGRTTALVLLDLSAAFNTVSHGLLLERLWESGVGSSSWEWIKHFLQKRSFQVLQHPFKSKVCPLSQRVPQGSALSPTLFNIYMRPLADIVRKHGVKLVSYADDTQLIVTLEQKEAGTASAFKACLSDLANWMKFSCLQLNAG